MKAIRPIYDGKDDLDFREEMDDVDLLACFFSELNDRIDSMEDATEEYRSNIRGIAEWEFRFFGYDGEVHLDLDMDIDNDVDGWGNTGGYDELIVTYEIKRWLEECGYDWDIIPDRRYRYHSMILGLIDEEGGVNDSGLFVLRVSEKAFAELKKLLRVHWAIELLDWYPIAIKGVGKDKEMLQFGNIIITK